jgi:serine O-acetyltransferase
MGVPGRVVIERDPATGERRRVDGPLSRTINLPDPELEVIRCLHTKVLELEARIAELESGDRADRAAVPHATSTTRATNGDAKAPNDETERAIERGLAALEGRNPRA